MNLDKLVVVVVMLELTLVVEAVVHLVNLGVLTQEVEVLLVLL